MQELAALLFELLRHRPAWFRSLETSSRDSRCQLPHTGCLAIQRRVNAGVSLTRRLAPKDPSLRIEIKAEPWHVELRQLDRRLTSCGSDRALDHS